MREMAELTVEDNAVTLDLPVQAPELTLRLTGRGVNSVFADGIPVPRAHTRAAFESQTFYEENGTTYVAFDPQRRATTLNVL